MEVFNGVWNEVHLLDLVMLEDEIIAFHDKLSCQLVLAFFSVGSAACSEKEDMSSA